MPPGQSMSTPLEPVRQLCQHFSDGRHCPQRRNCPFIHKWALFNAARKERRLAKFEDSQRDADNRTCTSKHTDPSLDMPQGEKIKPGNCCNKTLVQVTDFEVTKTLPASNEKSQQSFIDAPSSRPGKSQDKNRGKKLPTDDNDLKTANHTNEISKTMKKPHSFKLNQSLPNLSPGQHADKQTPQGKAPYSSPWRYATNQSISRNMAPLTIHADWANYRWNEVRMDRDNQTNNFGCKITEDMKYPNVTNGQAGQVLRVRDARMRYYGNIGQEQSSYEVKDSKPLERFILFLQLPFEIRLVIWQIMIRFPYNPTVSLEPTRDHTGAIVFRDLICQSMSPIVLRINRESRTEALKHYTLTLGNTTYLHKSCSTLFLDSDEPGELTHFVASVPHEELQIIENLAVRLCEWSWMDESFKQAIWQFSNIKRLMMMFHKSDDSFYLRKEAFKLIAKELKQPEESQSPWKMPIIGLVKSDLVEGFLKSNTFA